MSSTSKLALRYRSYPGHEQVTGNDDDTYDPEDPYVIRVTVAIDEQEHDAAEVAGCAG